LLGCCFSLQKTAKPDVAKSRHGRPAGCEMAHLQRFSGQMGWTTQSYHPLLLWQAERHFQTLEKTTVDDGL
jgi:hypothetical protein